ncbi:Methyl-accepting chemotaxis protein OS=Ureibacillus acetophenoni OX=614649 GN=SAMN05877842_10461 PE=3 SV=1 [Ureibacillus acetophenoni]
MKFSIRKKLWFGFGFVLFLLITISLSSLFTINDLSKRYQNILDIEVGKINLAKEIEILQKDAEISVLEYITLSHPSSIVQIKQSQEKGFLAINSLKTLTTNSEIAEIIPSLESSTSEFYETADYIISLKSSGRNLDEALTTMKDNNDVVATHISQLIELENENISQVKTDIETHQSWSFLIVFVITIINIVLGLAIATVMAFNITSPIRKVTSGLDEIAKGNLYLESLHIKNRDEIGLMAQTYNTMLTDLRQIVQNVRDSSVHLASSAEELSATSEETLASSQLVATTTEKQLLASEQQVHLMDKSVDTLEKLDSSVIEIESSNEDMLQSTDHVHGLVLKGYDVVSEVVHQMDRIHETFKETTSLIQNMDKQTNVIHHITSLITDISDQTNLLALNAAIEAARAGEYGKGFAVVANEVKKLAEQSKTSANQITQMVKEIQIASKETAHSITTGTSKVNDGIEKTQESLQVFNEIKESVNVVIEKADTVTKAIHEIQQLTMDVKDRINKVQAYAKDVASLSNETSAATEQHLAANEEIASSSQSLTKLAETLQKEVGHFRI